MKLHSIFKSASAPIALSFALLANPSFAQSTAGASASDDSIIVVTGTRIKRPETGSATPVVSVTADNIEQSGEIDLTDLLKQTPALIGSVGSYEAAGSQARTGAAGVNLLDLRNLGANRTLVLVDGRRHVAGVPGEAAVDINTIPTALVERIDVLTGGVSSIYGADGVSGVVNFIMKRDFEGLDVRAQQGISDFDDADSTLFSVTAGHNIDGGRGNIALSYEYRRQERVAYGDRPHGQFDTLLLVQNPDDAGIDDPKVPDEIPLPFVGYSGSSPGGAVAIDGSLAPGFGGDGALYNPGTFLPASGSLSTGDATTDDTPMANYQGDLQAQNVNHIVNLIGNYELTDRVSFFAEGKYVKTDTYTVAQPSFDFYTYIPADNAFIPDAISDTIAAGNLSGFGLDDGLLISRDNFDLGTHDKYIDREVIRTVVGLDGELAENANFEISYTFGQNTTNYTNTNFRYFDRYFAALDAVDEGQFLNGTPNGNIVCRSDLNGGAIVPFNLSNVFGSAAEAPPATPQTFPAGDGSCEPLNLFGNGAPSQAALNFINADLQNEYTLTQYILNGFVSGDFGKFFELPGGPIGYAFGAEYRKEKSVSFVDDISKTRRSVQNSKSVLSDLALLADERGEFDVYEAFAELNVPLLADMPFAHRLEFNAALRVSDYSTSGYSDTWSVSGVWAPARDISLRGSYSQATRAPNITELFAPATGAFSQLDDPCDPTNIANGTAFRAENCRALIEGLGIDYDNYDFASDVVSSAGIAGFASGNANLEQEEATTWTAGVVLQPAFLPGLSISFDWFDIDLENAINTTTLTRLAEFCVDSASLDNEFCQRVDRSPSTGYVAGYQLQPVNVAFFETAGADMTLNYSHDLGASSQIAVRGTLGYLDKLNFLPANGGIVNADKGELGSPEWNGNADATWSNDNWNVNYGLRYIGKSSRYTNDVIAGNPDIAAPEYIYYDARFIHDARVEYTTSEQRFSIYAGVNNFTNEMPELGSIRAQTGWLGRYFFAGIRIRMDTLGF
ncbi:TonB-dependent receptor plug domain-containing protein [Aurantiacibacter suaedae]|uniref:TonB-dependent receptor plug domain-containing protein n=1 Tax=Aurantiacibacter suaedae TaxID=2545755 RepID=UPI0010F81DB8|nr:TonB-dependent receptor [Aurantiacibacter suaedae]